MAVLVNAAWVHEARKTQKKNHVELVEAVRTAFGFSPERAEEAVRTASAWMGRTLQSAPCNKAS